MEASVPATPQEAASNESKSKNSIKLRVILEDPQMIHMTDFILPEEIEHILALAEGRWERSSVTRGSASSLLKQNTPAKSDNAGCSSSSSEVVRESDGGHDASAETESAGEAAQKPVDLHSETRTSWSVRLGYEESPVVEQILGRAATVSGMPLSHVEELVVLRYSSGETFKLHHDGAMRPKTIFVYLNDVPIGGETRFPRLGIQIRPAGGTAVMWNNTIGEGDGVEADRRMDHEAAPPGEGYVKYGMNVFMNCRPQRDTSHITLVPSK